MKQLPDLPSALIRLALDDLERAEKDPRYEIDMGAWHEPVRSLGADANEGCAVCLAGSVMAFSLEADIGRCLEPYNFHDDVAECLRALNLLRTGDVEEALMKLGLLPRYDLDRKIMDYNHGPAEFKADMRQLADDLECEGL